MLCAIVLAVTLSGHLAFERAVQQDVRDAQALTVANRLAADLTRLRSDAVLLTTSSSAREFAAQKDQLRASIRLFQIDYTAACFDPAWHAPATAGPELARVRHALAALTSSADPHAATGVLATLLRPESAFEADIQRAVHTYSADLSQRMSRRLWIYGAIVPGGCAFLIVGLSALLLPRALRRIRQVNDTLIRLEAASAHQAAELEARNEDLQSQRESLRASEAELIMKTQQLEATSLGSQQAARRFEELFQGLPVACVGFSDDGRVFEWNRASSEMFGHDAYRVLHMKLWSYIADHTFARRGASIVRQVFLGKEFRNTEWEYTRPDGKRRNILGHLFPLRGVDGRILGGVAACLDVTDRKRAEEELRSSEKLFRDLIDSLHEGVLLYDESGRIKVANRQAAALLGMPQSALHGKRIEQLRDDFVDAENGRIDAKRLPSHVCMKTGKPVENACVGFRGRPGRNNDRHWFSVSSIPLYRPDEEYPYGVLSSFSEITERLEYEDQLKSHVKALAAAHEELQQRQKLLEQANAKLEALAVTDGLTGLYNHRAFQEKLEELVHDSSELSLVLIDVDHFKDYNDTFGHPEGDVVLRRVALMLKDAVGSTGVTARYGGEEFAIILPAVDEDAGHAFAEALCSSVASAPWPNRSVTISAGVATICPAWSTPQALIRAADNALYASKRDGRNRATHAAAFRNAA